MKKYISKSIFLSFALIIGLVLTGCGASAPKEGEVKITFTSKSEKGNNVDETVEKIKGLGFTNVITEEIPDLITGWLTKDGEVEEVRINDDVSYKTDTWVIADTLIVVSFHTFPTKEKETVVVPEEPEEVMEEQLEDVILTIDNCEDLNVILNVKSPSDQLIIDFVEKYKGKKIQFDGYSWDWANHTTTSPFSGKEKVYKTKYTTNFYVGNIETLEEDVRGPIFRAEAVSFPSFVPSLNRSNMTVTATVNGFKEANEFFLLGNVTIEPR